MHESKSIHKYIYKKGKESVVLRIASYKRALESAKVKLRNNVPQTSSAVTAIMRVDSLYYAISVCTRKLERGIHVSTLMTAHVCTFAAIE